ncbi:GerMN domain-containing protein [Micromonospora sp. NPDC049051]|uniref:GerMN domain-containing protein n=1 Tax=Micromonospora sp. NPDC049051 TaxID=3364264 RepID=UPI0037146B4A
MRRAGRWRGVGGALLVLGLLGGCGVSVEDTPRVVAPPPGPFPSPGVVVSTPSPTLTAGRATEILCFVRDDRLVRVERRVDGTPTVDAQLQHLLAGPTAAERDTGLTTALPGAVPVAVARPRGTEVDVDLGGAGDETGRSDEVLAFGQIVCTLTARSDVDTVGFFRGGAPLGVPRADGSLSRRPLAADDYAGLVAPR